MAQCGSYQGTSFTCAKGSQSLLSLVWQEGDEVQSKAVVRLLLRYDYDYDYNYDYDYVTLRSAPRANRNGSATRCVQ